MPIREVVQHGRHRKTVATDHNVKIKGVQADSNADDFERKFDGESQTSPSENLIVALEALILPSLRMQKTRQLPFLLRNLRRGFAYRCSLVDVLIKPAMHTVPSDVRVIFRLMSDGSVSEEHKECSHEYTISLNSWTCPICDFHGSFRSQTMLQKHLEWDHSEAEVHWTHDSEVSSRFADPYFWLIR